MTLSTDEVKPSCGEDVPDYLSVTLSMYSCSKKTISDSCLDNATVFEKVLAGWKYVQLLVHFAVIPCGY